MMKPGIGARAFAAGVIATMCMALATAADDADMLSESPAPSDFGARNRHHQLDLPATTACLDELLATGRAQNSHSGIAAAVVLDGRVVYRRGFGTISPTSTQAVRSTTRFRLGSVTKAVTAMAVLSLAEDGRIRMHAPVTRLLPGFSLSGEPGWLEQLTAQRLLSNQGGIADPSNGMGPSDDGALAAAFYDPAFTSTVPLLVEPGTFYNYSSTNFMLAGLLAETAAGKPYRLVVRQRVFKPLDMKRATFLSSDVTSDTDAAWGSGVDRLWAPGEYDDSIERPAGMAWVSVDDLAKLAKFILRGDRKVLAPHHWRAIQTPQVDMVQPSAAKQSYGYGLVIEEGAGFPDGTGVERLYPVRSVWHDGAVPGYRSLSFMLPQQQFGFVALVNGDVESQFTDPVPCMRIAATETISSRLPAPIPFPTPQIERDRFVDYVGSYQDRYIGGRAILFLGPAGGLRIQLPDLDAGGFVYDPILYPVNKDNFELRTQVGSLLLTGFREGGSNVAYLRTRVTVFARSPDGTTASAQRTAAPVRDPVAFMRAIQAAARERDTLLPQ
jgi:CubicO group peptidase (beta-lactamase class C family)